MKRSSFQRYQNRKALCLYGLIDLLIPPFLLSLIHFCLTPGAFSKSYCYLAALSGLFFLLGTAFQGGYSRYNERSISKKLEITFKTWFINVFLLLTITYFYLVTSNFDRVIMTLWVISTPIIVVSLKITINNLNRKISKTKIEVAVLGRNYKFNEHEHKMLKSQAIKLTYIDFNETDKLQESIETISPDYLLLNLEKPANEKLVKELTHINMKGTRVIELFHFMEAFLRKCYIPYDQQDLSYLDTVHSYNTTNYCVKRIIDWCAVLVLGTLTIPVMLASACKIKKQSPGKIFFSQSRVGVKGESFKAVKFRSMHENAKFDPYTQKEDPRIFPFGNFMRKSRIDELPQLWNVAKGEMHLLGPRTEWDILVENYEKEIPYYHERHLVRPGISGWAQVLYPYGANTEDSRQKLMYDLYYIKHWSIWLEMETLIRTIGVVLGKKGL
ncbi:MULTISPECIES: exopolysaccharide biosynthesis polyprenyl glycosylphosphotransferase [Marinomonas]|uniref:exopolysaccharide biosynthesis polyprenyl glycosylphosphotransferase n=1 Tax=Marinomonas TaxID=28253 RepID=UPI0010544AB2|nr:exopolysaccharide biosynthesis polyprenyl glycosylphosphotransferase [Marinomonas sp. KMM3893]